MPNFAKKTLSRKKYKNLLCAPSKRIKSTQTSASVFADRIEQVKKTKNELEQMKIVDCSLDGHGNSTSNLVTIKKIL